MQKKYSTTYQNRFGLIISGHRNDELFSLTNTKINRDNAAYPYFLIKKILNQSNVEIHTSDYIAAQKEDPSFIIYNDYRPNEISPPKSARKYILALETPEIHKNNSANSLATSDVDIIFTWRTDIESKNIKKIFFPNKIILENVTPARDRTSFACLIAGNKSSASHQTNDLYSERLKTIRWFESNHLNLFSLYGIGWDKPAMPRNAILKKAFKLYGKIPGILKKRPFKSYRGTIESKQAVLNNYKFCICYENYRNHNSYITEKIFDCFFAGCIPIYWGAPDIQDHIPEDCFIDRRKFQSHEQLFEHMCSLNDTQLEKYQANIRSFLLSDKAVPFSAEYFATTITNQILKDIGRLD